MEKGNRLRKKSLLVDVPRIRHGSLQSASSARSLGIVQSLANNTMCAAVCHATAPLAPVSTAER